MDLSMLRFSAYQQSWKKINQQSSKKINQLIQFNKTCLFLKNKFKLKKNELKILIVG